MSERERHKTRKSVSRDSGRQVLVIFPEAEVEAMDQAAVANDMNRSQWVRKACRQLLNRHGVNTTNLN